MKNQIHIGFTGNDGVVTLSGPKNVILGWIQNRRFIAAKPKRLPDFHTAQDILPFYEKIKGLDGVDIRQGSANHDRNHEGFLTWQGLKAELEKIFNVGN